MKTKIQTLLLALACLAGSANADVTFNVTPSAVSNTYAGTITLQIGGLTNKTVVIQKFLDLNPNGVIDGGDVLVQQFILQDGINFVIGGVTNFDVPGDLDATTGAITATLNFRNGDFVQNIVGNYLYMLSSPGGHFEPLTNQFAVTNFPFPQMFTGNVVSNGASTTVSNAIILLFPPPQPGENGPGGSPLAGVVADNAGSYTVQMPPGTYMPVALANNYVANMSTAPMLTLAASQTITTNLTLANATTSISGNVVDAGNPGIGLPGLLLPVQSADGLLAITFTDTNGNFNVPVTAGTWEIKADDSTLIIHGYVRLQNGTNVNAGQTGVTLAYPKATALIYGSVTDNLGNPLPGIKLYADDKYANLYESDGYTGTNGSYVIAVLGGLGGGDPWQMDVNSDNSLANYIFSRPFSNGSTNINTGAAVQANIIALLVTNYITGNVKANGTNISGVQVFANTTINGATLGNQANTDTNGNYSLKAGNGSWNIGVNCNFGTNSLDAILGSGNYQCPNSQSTNIFNNNAVVNFTVQPCGPLQVSTTSPLPDGQVNSFYQIQLLASGCHEPFLWSLKTNSLPLPPGLTLASNGNLSGTPTNQGTFNFDVRVVDNTANFADQTLSLTINPSGPSPLQVTTTSLPNGTNGLFYSQQLGASGGQPPYNWSLSPGSGSLPPGLFLATNGILSGIPVLTGTYNFSVRVTDNASNTADQSLSLTISIVPLQVATTSLPNAALGVFYSRQLGAFGGQPPYGWSLSPGSASLPPGLSLATNGVLSGTPTNNANFYFSVRVTDFVSDTRDQNLELTVVASTNLPLITLYSFSGSDGSSPNGLAQGTDGNFYGTTYRGGAYTNYNYSEGVGTVFKMTPPGALNTLYSFSDIDGANPIAGLVQGADGNFYGMTEYGGEYMDQWGDTFGTAFKIMTNGTFTSLYSFSGSDGANPVAGLALGADGNFYGTTEYGGVNYYLDDGTAFKITTNGSFTSLISFSGRDGIKPKGGLVQGTDGNFYGTTSDGGRYLQNGTVFKMTTNGTLSTLYSFTGGSDGDMPVGGLVQGTEGNLYGTTQWGGTNNSGTVFKITTNGTFTSLCSFRGSDNAYPAIGPAAGLVQGADGNFYGTTYRGGAYLDQSGFSQGTVFKITPDGALTTVYSFTGGNDGANPNSALVQGTDGNFYGTTESGGAHGNGAIFRLSLVSPPAPVFQSVTKAGGTITLTWSALAGQPYQLQFKTNLNQTSWNNSGSPITATNSTVIASDSIGPDPQRFYRVKIGP